MVGHLKIKKTFFAQMYHKIWMPCSSYFCNSYYLIYPAGDDLSMKENKNKYHEESGDIVEIENNKIPRGHVTLVGLGRLGIRTGINLTQVHRGGPLRITAIDSQKISEGDLIFRMMGGENGGYKVDLLHDLRGIKEVEPIRKDINQENLGLIGGDVVCVEIAGGNTIPITAAIIKQAHKIGARTISTAGVFGIGEEEIRAMDISHAPQDNPVANELKQQGINSDHTLVTTGKFIRDWEPVTPYVLDEVAGKITMEILKLLRDVK